MFQKPSGHIPIIEGLRGIACVMVCIFHFTKGYVPDDSWARYVGSFGWMGVEVFFVISGFVIPFSLLKGSFSLRQFGAFIKKRVYRIEPAYLLSIAVVLLLNFAASKVSGYQGEPFGISWQEVGYHLGYLINFTDSEWLNPVYWSLEVEFHYYIMIGLLVAFWRGRAVLWASVGLFTLLPLLPFQWIALMKFTDIFALGILAALFYLGRIKQRDFIVALLVSSLVVFYNHGWILGTLTLSTALVITFFSGFSLGSVLSFLGKISFSLYLLHVPIGGRVINLAKRLELSYELQLLVVSLALAVSILASWIFYVVVERPSFRWSKSIKYQ